MKPLTFFATILLIVLVGSAQLTQVHATQEENPSAITQAMIEGDLSKYLPAPAAGALVEPQHLLWARDIAENVSRDKNVYASDPNYILWPDTNGVGTYENRTTCAPFITRVLMQSYGWNGTYFKNWMASTSPYSNMYYDNIKKQNGFIVISNVKDIKPGDIIAIKYPAGSSVTGHMMMVSSVATPRTATAPKINLTYQYEIQVIDSSQTGHGPTDTRLMEDGTYSPGAGTGVFRLYADSTGVIKGYAWSTYNSSIYYDQTTRALVVGRLS